MPRTVQAALAEYVTLQVDLDPTQVTRARASRDFLSTSLVNSVNAAPGSVRMTGEVQQYGSFARRTKIRPLNDIDLMFVINVGDVAFNQTWFSAGAVTVSPAPLDIFAFGNRQTPVDRRFLNPTGDVNSTVILNEVRGRLQGVPQYSSAVIKRNGVAVVLDLVSYTWNFDVVPAISVPGGMGTTDYYVIPDGRGGWQKTDPRRDAQNTTRANQQCGGRLLPLIRLMKAWNVHWGHPVGSYHLETLCIRAFPWGIPSDPLGALQQCLTQVAAAITRPCPDPKGLGAVLDAHLDATARERIVGFATASSSWVQQATAAASRGDHRSASQYLQRVFGTSFPVCP